MYKKLLISIGILIAIILSFSVCCAEDNSMAQNLMDGLHNTANSAGNTIKGATTNVTEGARNIVEDMTNENNMNNDSMMANTTNTQDNTEKNNDTGNYTATRTATEDTTATFMGMTATAWTWLILGIAAIAIVALVWYYSAQLRSPEHDDRH